MLPVQISYPAFEANQVLSNEHLNQLFAYLDEQERLTRTNLIGIGIVCGLEPTLSADGTALRISKGCGVTSEGYLIVWPDAAPLEWYRPYTVPESLPYDEFEDRSSTPAQAFPLWELTPDRNNDPDAVQLSRDFLTGTNQPTGSDDEKILVLFLECLAESNRNCTPNSCADKGTTVTATVRPLLVRRSDMDLLLERIQALGPETQAYFSLADSMSARLGLPTLKLPRFDVAATYLNNTASVFDAFQRVLNPGVVQSVAAALSDTYSAFQPLLPDYASNPFANLNTDWTFLYDGSIETTNRYLWYQYFYDHLDTIIQAYNEFRLRSLEVLGLCCPDSRLFPRHLMLANLGVDPPGYDYRHTFVPSPLFTRQLGALAELRQLFRRLVLLVQGLELPPNVGSFIGLVGNLGNVNTVDTIVDATTGFGNFTTAFNNLTAFRPRFVTDIKITPSKLASPLSEKAIPYHYQPVPLYETWNYHLTRQGKARENLGYRSPSWNTIDDFVRFPLNYELEPYNFLRVEGHIGQNFQSVLADLLAQKDRFRLPIDIVALKTGRNSDSIPLPSSVDECHFQDLETLYDSLREEFLCRICELIMRLYNTPILTNEQQGGTQTFLPGLTFLRNCAPDFRYRVDTVGQLYEANLSLHTAAGPSFANVPFSYGPHVYYIFYLVRLAETMAESLTQLDFTTFRNSYTAFMSVVRAGNDFLLGVTNDEADINLQIYPGVDLEELSDQLDMLLYSCKLEPIQSVWEEYQRRLQRVKESLLLATFTRQHPGLTHKAGVPVGGTFVIIYHGEDQQGDTVVQTGRFVLRGRVTIDGDPLPGVTIFVGPAAGTTTDLDGNFQIIVNELPVVLRVSAVGAANQEILVTDDLDFLEIDLNDPDSTGSSDRYPELAVGAVIADFYLPYLCCSDCHPIQFVLPKPPPSFSWEQIGCTVLLGQGRAGSIVISPEGGTPPYEISNDAGQNWTVFSGEPLTMLEGTQIMVRDAEGVESAPQTIDLFPPLSVDISDPVCSEDASTFTVDVFVNGGRPPYRLINGEEVILVPADGPAQLTYASGQGGAVVVEDSSEPACQQTLSIPAHECEQACPLPCEGITLECGHPFWMQRNATNQMRYQEVQLRVSNLVVQGEDPTQAVSLNPEQLQALSEILSPGGNINNANAFNSAWNSRIPAANEFIQSIMQETFGEQAGTILNLRYDPTTVNRFTTLWIETYACFQFIFELQVRYFGNTTKLNYVRSWRYSNAGSEVKEIVDFSGQVIEGEAIVPRYNCTQRDRCNPDNPPVSLCTDPFSVSAASEPLTQDLFRLFAQPEDITANAVILWDVQQGFPGIGNVMPFDTRVPQAFPNGNRSRVLVINPETGCAAGAQGVIQNG